MIRKLMAALSGSLIMAFATLSPIAVSAAAPIVVTPSDTQGWTTAGPLADNRTGGTVNFISDSTSPAGVGALQLTTTSSVDSKAQYMHLAPANSSLANITDLSYYTSTSFAQGDPSYQLAVCLTGVTGSNCSPGTTGTTGATSFDTLVYEPYQNGTVTPGAWQNWNVDAGKFWSSRTVNCSTGNGVLAGGGGEPFYTLADILAKCPNAVVASFGVNIGSNNPSYNVETDLFNFNGTVYNFEPIVGPATTLADCAIGTWQTFNSPSFSTRSACLQYVAAHRHDVTGNITYTAGNLVRHASFGMNTLINQGSFGYWDANNNWYIVKVSSVKVSGDDAWFAGKVTFASNPSWVGNWLFAKVADNSPDKIWGSFTTQSAALTGVSNMTNPGDGPFRVTNGNLEVK